MAAYAAIAGVERLVDKFDQNTPAPAGTVMGAALIGLPGAASGVKTPCTVASSEPGMSSIASLTQ